MKKLLLIIASLFIVTNVANANPTHSDLEFAFGESIKTENVLVLDDAQMSAIQGKGWKKWKKKIKKYVKKNKEVIALQAVGTVLFFVTDGLVYPTATGIGAAGTF